MSLFRHAALCAVIALVATPAMLRAQDPVARNTAVTNASYYVNAVAQTVEAKRRLADRIAALAGRAASDRFGAKKLDAQAQELVEQMDALGDDMRQDGVNLIAAGARDWRADLVGAARNVDGVDLSAAALDLDELSLATPDGARTAISRAQRAAERLAKARAAFEADVKAIVSHRVKEPDAEAAEKARAEAQTNQLGGGLWPGEGSSSGEAETQPTTAEAARAAPDPASALMSDIIRDLAAPSTPAE